MHDGEMKTFRSLLAAGLLTSLASVVLLTACGVQSESDVCTQRQKRHDACPYEGSDKGKPAFDSAKCSKDYRCTVSVFQTSASDAYFTCQTNQDCSAKVGDTCFDQALQKGSNTEEADVCAKKRAECKAEGKSFSDDYCPQLRVYNADLLEKMMTCIDKPCDQISDCLKSTIEAAAPACD